MLGIAPPVGVFTRKRVLVVARNGGGQSLAVDTVNRLVSTLAGAIGLDVRRQLLKRIALEEPSLLDGVLVAAPLEEGVVGVMEVPHAGIGVDDSSASRPFPKRLGIEKCLVEHEEEGQMAVVAGLGVEIEAVDVLHIVGAGAVFFHEALAVVVDDKIVVGRNAIGGVG